MRADQVSAMLARRIRDDPEYRAKRETFAAELDERARRTSEAEQPVVRALTDVGIDVNSVWDLYKTPDILPKAIPVLLSHLVRDYPDPVLQGIGQALSNRAARPHWAELKTLYTTTANGVVRDRLADVLSICATRAHYDELLSFLQNDALGETRIYFLRPINRIGNRISPGTGRRVIARLADDAIFGREARAILAGRGRND